METRTVLPTLLLLFGTSAAYTASTIAAPTVKGQVISWPNDGWYQVQTADTYQQVCAGVHSCTVEPGTYIVINHSTGERFERIKVSAGSGGGGEPPVTAVTVNGNVISWPDDGWYQVQTADTYQQVCAGGRSCEVESGTYIVVNHTTGERFEGIKVSGGSGGGGEPPATDVTVNGNVISWPDDGWYQVQSADTYQQMCAGGRSCEVEPGTYIVINHTTGKRFNNIEVEGSSAPQALITMDSHVDIVANVLAIYSGKLYGDELVFSPRYSDPTFQAWPEVDIVTAELITQPSDIVCDNGGTLKVTPESQGFHTDNILTWNFDFDDCQDDAAMFNGTISRGIYESLMIESDGFTYDDQLKVVQFSGLVEGRTSRLVPVDDPAVVPSNYHNFWRSTNADFSQISSNGSLIIEDATTDFYFRDMEATGVFSVQADWTGDQKISAQTLSDFDPNNDTGQLEIVAESGNRLLLDAETGDTETVNVTITANGVSETVTQPWALWSDNFIFTTTSGH